MDPRFYHRYRLKQFVVFELKIERFRSEQPGQLQDLRSAVDGCGSRHGRDTIGTLLLPEKNDGLVKLALSGSATPLADRRRARALSTPTPDEPGDRNPSTGDAGRQWTP